VHNRQCSLYVVSCWAKSESLHTPQINQLLSGSARKVEASNTSGVDAQYKGMELRGKRRTREWGEVERVTKDSKLLVEGDPYDSGYPEGRNFVGGARESCDKAFTMPLYLLLQ